MCYDLSEYFEVIGDLQLETGMGLDILDRRVVGNFC